MSLDTLCDCMHAATSVDLCSIEPLSAPASPDAEFWTTKHYKVVGVASVSPAEMAQVIQALCSRKPLELPCTTAHVAHVGVRAYHDDKERIALTVDWLRGSMIFVLDNHISVVFFDPASCECSSLRSLVRSAFGNDDAGFPN